MKNNYTLLKTALVSMAICIFALAQANEVPPPGYTVQLPGNFQSELGCSGDWMPECAITNLTFNPGNGMWEGNYTIPAGNWEFKVTHNGTWGENYGLNGVPGGSNIPLFLAASTLVHFVYNPNSHMVTLGDAAYAVVLAGSFQNEVGCSGDWMPDCPATMLYFDAVNNRWGATYWLPPGNHEFKVAINNSWAENYGVGGVPGGANYALNLPAWTQVGFRYDPVTHIVTYNTSIPYAVNLAGSFQSELGCTGDWMPDCWNTALTYSPGTALWTADYFVPPGNWEFKVTINNSWNENYGAGGVPGGPNIPLNLTEPSLVRFDYDPFTHIVAMTVNPYIVVLPASFQNEVGCPPGMYSDGDWEPACENTRLFYDAATQQFVRDLDIPQGYWEYKVAINNSWNINYGLGGIRDGANIPLHLEAGSARIRFRYNPLNHMVTEEYLTSTVCATAFYDANLNGMDDEGIYFENTEVTLSGDAQAVQYTNDKGKTCFSALMAGNYTVTATVPSYYYAITNPAQSVYLGAPQQVNFGLVCLGAGGGHGVGYWISKHGETAVMNTGWFEDIMYGLRKLNLRNSNGTDFDPYTYDELREWLQKANAKNMTQKMSAEMVALALSMETGFVDWNAWVYAGGFGYQGYQSNFAKTASLLYRADELAAYFPFTPGQDMLRAKVEDMVKILSDINNNLTFVQAAPCSTMPAIADRIVAPQASREVGVALQIWPNPSQGAFTLRTSTAQPGGRLQLKVYDLNGKMLLNTGGAVNSDIRFGASLAPGMYMVEVMQGQQRQTLKIVKQ